MKSKRRYHGDIVKKNRVVSVPKADGGAAGESRLPEVQSTDKDIEVKFFVLS